MRFSTSCALYPVIFRNPSEACTMGQSGSVGSHTVNVVVSFFHAAVGAAAAVAVR